MNKEELLNELDSYFAARGTEEELQAQQIGDIKVYQVRGAILRADDRAEDHNVIFFVHKEGLPQESAYYAGDPIQFFWRKKVIDHITITNDWLGKVYSSKKPRAICTIFDSLSVGEKWILVTETAPDTYQVEDITGPILTDF